MSCLLILHEGMTFTAAFLSLGGGRNQLSLPSLVPVGISVQAITSGFVLSLQIIGVIFIGVGSYVVHKGNSSNYDELLGFLDERDPAQKDNNITPAEGLLVDALAVKGTLLTVGGFLITIGLATFFLSTCGWLGACKQNTCLLFVVSKTAHHWPTKPHLPITSAEWDSMSAS